MGADCDMLKAMRALMTLIEKAEGKTVCTLIPSITSDNTGMIQVLNLPVSFIQSLCF